MCLDHLSMVVSKSDLRNLRKHCDCRAGVLARTVGCRQHPTPLCIVNWHRAKHGCCWVNKAPEDIVVSISGSSCDRPCSSLLLMLCTSVELPLDQMVADDKLLMLLLRIPWNPCKKECKVAEQRVLLSTFALHEIFRAHKASLLQHQEHPGRL